MFFTEYRIGEKLYSSNVFARNVEEADYFCKIRGLSEEIVSNEIHTDKEFYGFKEKVSDMFLNNRNPFLILHGVCWLENINQNVDTLKDNGLLHELIHYYQDPTCKLNLTVEDIYNKIVELENRTPGFLNKI